MLIGAAAAAAFPAHAEKFSWQLGGVTRHTEAGGNFDADSWVVDGTYYVNPIDDTSGPYALASFLNPTTRVSAAASGNDPQDAFDDPTAYYTLSGAYVLPGERWYVGASYANYNADCTRTIPVSGRFTKRQRKVYDAVLRVQRASIKSAKVGKLHRDWQRESQMMMNEELLKLGLLKSSDIKNQTEEEPACRRYYMHGLGHSLGLDVHLCGEVLTA